MISTQTAWRNTDMKFLEFLKTYNGALSVIGTLVVAILTSFSVFVSMRTLREMKKTREDENRPYVIVYLSKEPRDLLFELCIKNFGKTAAKIEFLEFSLPIKTHSGELADHVFQGVTLMPNQKIHTLFMKDDTLDVRKFESMHLKCKYSLLGDKRKIYDDEYVVNYEYTKEFAYAGDTTMSNQNPTENSLASIAKTLDIIRRQQ